MYPDLSLKENVTHVSRKTPIWAMQFTAGPGTSYPEHFFKERHWHNYVEMLLVTKGDYLLEINLENHILKEGDICILNSEELHQITGLCTGAVHEVILFHPQILSFSYADEWEETYIAPYLNQALVFRNILPPSGEGYSEILSAYRSLMNEALRQADGWYIKCKLLLLELFRLMAEHRMLLPAKEAVSEADSRKINRYKTIVSYIEAHYGEPVSLQQLADTIPCNSQYLCRFFREIAGMSPIRYLIVYRLERASELLLRTKKPVTEIAFDCGFDNISYFIRKFKAVKGCTPKEYREMHYDSSSPCTYN